MRCNFLSTIYVYEIYITVYKVLSDYSESVTFQVKDMYLTTFCYYDA
jgi:hypothetical protein